MEAIGKSKTADLEQGSSIYTSTEGSFSISDDAHNHKSSLPSSPLPLGEFNGCGSSTMSAPDVPRHSSSKTTTTGSDGSDGSVLVLVKVEVDLKSGVGISIPHPVVVVVPEINYDKKNPHLVMEKKSCRICQLSLDDLESTVVVQNDDESSLSGFGDVGVPVFIELGCSCKDDLAAAHKHCAEAWFKIKGNKICEICGETARNLVGTNDTELLAEQRNETSDTLAATTTVQVPSVAAAGTQNFWHGHRLLNLVLACVVFGFVISWLFHFNMPS